MSQIQKNDNEINIMFMPSKKQELAWDKLTDDTTTFVGYGGSAFSGKSYLMCYWLTIQCIAYPETAWGLGRKELSQIKRYTLDTLFKVFAECNITQDHYVYNQQLNTIRFFNGSKIYLLELAFKPSDPLYQRFGGMELTGAAVDESGEVEHSAINMLATRCGRRRNKLYNIKKKVLETFNPAKNHVYNRYYLPYVKNEMKAEYCFIKALPSDNPSPEVEDYVNSIIASGDKVTIERLVYGNFEYDNDPSALINYDNIINMFSNEHICQFKDLKMIGTLQDGKLLSEKYITVDVARLGKDSTMILVWYGLSVIKYKKYIKQTTDVTASIIKELQREYNIPMSNVIIDSDGVGGGLCDQLKGCIEFVNGSSPLHKENFTNLKTQCYYKLAEIVNKNNLYFKLDDVDIRNMLIAELELVKAKDIDKDGKKNLISKEVIKQRLGRSPDISDALMLRMYPIVRSSKLGGFSFHSF